MSHAYTESLIHEKTKNILNTFLENFVHGRVENVPTFIWKIWYTGRKRMSNERMSQHFHGEFGTQKHKYRNTCRESPI